MSYQISAIPLEIELPLWIVIDPERAYLGCPHGVYTIRLAGDDYALPIFDDPKAASEHLQGHSLVKLSPMMVCELADLAHLLESAHRAGIAYVKVKTGDFTFPDGSNLQPIPLLIFLNRVRIQQRFY